MGVVGEDDEEEASDPKRTSSGGCAGRWCIWVCMSLGDMAELLLSWLGDTGVPRVELAQWLGLS